MPIDHVREAINHFPKFVFPRYPDCLQGHNSTGISLPIQPVNYCLILAFRMKAYQLWLISSIAETRVCGLISSENSAD